MSKAHATKNLSPEGISLIITSCKDAQVRVLKYAGLYIEFDKPVRTARIEDFQGPTTEESPTILAPFPDAPAAEIAESQKHEAEISHLIQELDFKEDQLAEMWLTDPHAAEQMVINGQLEESDVGTTEEA